MRYRCLLYLCLLLFTNTSLKAQDILVNETLDSSVMNRIYESRLNIHNNNFSKALSSAQQAINISTNKKMKREKLLSLQTLSQVYEASGNGALALSYERKANAFKDSLLKIDADNQTAALITQVQKIKQENKEQQQEFENRKRQYLLIALSVFITMISLLGFSFYRRAKLKQEAKLRLEIIHQQDVATKAVIEAEENERNRIASDLHDGVGQMMSAVKMNLSGLAGKLHLQSEHDKMLMEKVIALVDESCTEVRNLSHNMMPNALLKSGLSSAVKEFIDKIDHSKLLVNLHAEGLNERLDSKVEIVLYRVIQEIVNNVIKHSKANRLDVSLIKDADGIGATIEDNGLGFDINNRNKFEGIGLKNIQTRINFLNGTVEFDSTPGKGTLVAIHIPVRSLDQ